MHQLPKNPENRVFQNFINVYNSIIMVININKLYKFKEDLRVRPGISIFIVFQH
jgi:hypothetical protein